MKALNLAVIGKDVSKSTSPEMHSFIAERLGYKVNYQKISIPEAEFESRVEEFFETLDGFNVTIPYKLTVMPHLKLIEGDARVFGAVNTVKCSDRSGNNTDGLGFSLMLKNEGVEVSGKDVLLLGAGGAGRSVAKKLLDSGATVYVYDKNTQNAQAVANEFPPVICLNELHLRPYFAIINATGVGMHKTEGISPVDEKLIGLCENAIDLIYTPPKSKFLELAESLGKKIINGEAMLFYQAYFAECIYSGLKPDDSKAKKLFTEYLKEKVK
ncbi:MAG: shikimate dehydrogenase [Clostridia bacterium]|nr:shikimate dehydrogenase [Clostridia bacterium]